MEVGTWPWLLGHPSSPVVGVGVGWCDGGHGERCSAEVEVMVVVTEGWR